MDIVAIIRIFNTSLIIIGIIAWLLYYKKYNASIAIAPLSWLINMLAFYLYRFYTVYITGTINVDFLNIWSSLLHTHAILLLIVGARLMMARPIKNKKEVK